MSLKEVLSTPPSIRPCKFTAWTDSLNDEDRHAVQDAMANRAWSIEKLTKALKAEGAPINYDMIRRHRANSCSACNR